MLSVKFQPNTESTVVKNQNYLTNGHWMVDVTKIVTNKQVFNRLKKWFYRNDGRYYENEWIRESNDITHIIPKNLKGYEKQENFLPKTVKFSDTDHKIIVAFIYETEKFNIAFAPEYIHLLDLGDVYLKDSNSPAIVRNWKNEFVAVLMPIRINDEKGNCNNT